MGQVIVVILCPRPTTDEMRAHTKSSHRKRAQKIGTKCVTISVIEPYGQRKHVITSAFQCAIVISAIKWTGE